MSISYEEALETLQAMFPAPWTRDTLDAVLRFEKGHMENTCERIMQHGDGDPQVLVDRLKAGGPEPQVAMDEQLARQLASGGSGATTTTNSSSMPAAATTTTTTTTSSGSGAKKGRGTPTTLPDDFLRIPGYKRSVASAANATANGAGAMDDETLARMLQDELFSEELARNPQFAHLATGRSSGGRGGSRSSGSRSSGRPSASGARIPAAPDGPNPFDGAKVMQKISDMGSDARKRLQLFAANFEQRINTGPGGGNTGSAASAAAVSSSLQEAHGAAAERRGLLDGDGDDEDMIEFETRKKRE
eukprot:CAMPEP_0113506236 /NCGR_PEP_ID=MMETSP0014_2-20120614/35793_1 /TAXON_ID=2857 /ORGANISM="Nitzschia sp." /LENGTH=302 /DNA_ID=CAMNT_0000401703 /DNA_START=247 /DNA_END=1155 /DNA_ORIENTATION=+ /assembly_acc=CAM_ASM_000159